AMSAGLEPKGVNPLTLKVLEEARISTSHLHSKPLSEFLGKVSVRYGIVVCDQADQACPRLYPFATRRLFWPFEDPAAFAGTDDERLAKFRDVRDQIAARIDQWLVAEEPGA
ncbi:MAG: arsenate reductase ArsC, partial [Prosthecobacter sp.]|nr:arsenate reductase ArsC [Prosthecobacter sp.]